MKLSLVLFILAYICLVIAAAWANKRHWDRLNRDAIPGLDTEEASTIPTHEHQQIRFD